MDRLKAGDVGCVTISSNGSALVNGLARHMSQFLAQYPKVEIDLYERLTPDVFEDVRKKNGFFQWIQGRKATSEPLSR